MAIASALIAANAIDPADATAVYTLASDGDIDASPGGDVGDWLSPKVDMGIYECRATLNSGALSSGSTGVWLALSSSRTWTRSQTSPGSTAAQLFIEIRRIGSTNVLASATIDLTATVEV